ncbi:MAG: hypothetical protein WCD86_22685 [Ktedonobacteraceae bacterium]
MAQVQIKVQNQALSVVSSKEVVPVEIIQLLNVLARIEARRQAKLQALRKEGR